MLRRSVFIGLVLTGCAATPSPTAFQSERIQVNVHGSGPDIILVPGMNSGPAVWAGTVASLRGEYRVHVIQVNGFAGAPARANADGPVVGPVAEELLRYISHAQLSRPTIVGHSMGGTIALMMATRHPEILGRIMVVDMMPFLGAMFGGRSAEGVRSTAEQVRAQMLAASGPARQTIVEQTIAGMVRDAGERAGLVQQGLTSDPTVSANAFFDLLTTDLREELGELRIPLTVLYVIPPDLPIPADRYEEFLIASYAAAPQTRLVRVEESYHFIMLDQPQRFIDELDRFLAVY